MRTIKFRAWVVNVVHNTMFYPEKIGLNSACAHSLWHKVGFITDMPDKYENQIEQWQKDIVWLQFTGLTDKNSKEIYEGDVITYKRSIGNWTGQYMTTTHTIVFSKEVFAFVMEYGSQYIKLRKHWGYEYEVIGNIYENPELLDNKL
jgi:uncharacterized phage protein (TIGR01671 family)